MIYLRCSRMLREYRGTFTCPLEPARHYLVGSAPACDVAVPLPDASEVILVLKNIEGQWVVRMVGSDRCRIAGQAIPLGIDVPFAVGGYLELCGGRVQYRLTTNPEESVLLSDWMGSSQ